MGGDSTDRPPGILAAMGGWTRKGRSGRFRYHDARGKRIVDADKLARIEALRIPPAWRDVRISPRPGAKLQATGRDRAGRRQYLYHPDYRARQEQEKYDKLVRFAERLPQLRAAMTEHLGLDELDPDRVCAVAARLIDLTWFRVGSERHTAYGVTTLRKRHVRVRGKRVEFSFRGKGNGRVRSALVDAELALALRGFQALKGGRRLFRYERDGELVNLTSRRLNAYIQAHMGEEFTAKDFRTWGGTLTAAIALAERGPANGPGDERRKVAAVMRCVAERLGNTPAVCRSSYVSPAVVEQYLDGRTLEDFRPRHLRVVSARQIDLDPEERALLSLLRSWRIREARKAA
jgi:DNA topoisomerase-1